MINKKMLVYGGIGLALLIIVVIVAVWIRRRKQNTVKDLPVNTANVSLHDSELKIMAGQLYTAMHGAGTDEKSIYRILEKLKTVDDWNALIKTFGIKEKGTWFTPFRGNLLDWLQDELTSKELKKCNEILGLIGATI